MKKLVVIFLSLLLCVSIFVTAGAAQNQTMSFAEDLERIQAIGFLKDIGSEDTISRAEAAKVLTDLMAVQDTLPCETVFSDVASDNPMSSNIMNAYKLGLISGYSDSTFRPSDNVTYVQMVKMLMEAMGYGAKARYEGGYPVGYVVNANLIGLTDGIAAEGDTPLLGGVLAKLLLNAVEIPVMTATSYNENGDVTYKESDKTIFELYHNISYIEGTVTANEHIVLEANEAIGEDSVAIDGAVYKAGESRAADLLGHTVFAFVKNDDIKTVLYAEPLPQSTQLIVSGRDILSQSSKNRIIYYEDREKKSVSVADDAVLILNNKFMFSWDINELLGEQTYLSMVLQNNKVKYIFANSYETYVVDWVNQETETIYFKAGGKLTSLSFAENIDIYYTEANGKAASLEYTFPWDVLSIAGSTQEGVLRIVRSGRYTSGAIEEMGADYIVVGGIQHRLAKDFDKKDLEVSDSANFFFNFAGEVVAFERTAVKNENYAFLVALDAGSGLSPLPQIKLFLGKDGMQVYDVAENLVLNNSIVKRRDFANQGVIVSGGKAVRQLITYELNGEGQISKINTAQDYSDDFENEDRHTVFSKDFAIDENSVGSGGTSIIQFWPGNMRMFAGRFRMNEESQIFVIPGEGAKDEEYGTKAFNEIYYTSVNSTVWKNIELYDVSENHMTSVMVQYESGFMNVPIHTDTVMIITDIVKALNNKGEEVFKISGIDEDNNEKTLYISDETDVFFGKALTDVNSDPEAPSGVRKDKIEATALKNGDIIQYVAKSTGDAVLINTLFRNETPAYFEMLYDSYTGSLVHNEANGRYVCMNVGYGTVIEAFPDGIIAEMKDINDPSISYRRFYPKTGITVGYNRDLGILDRAPEFKRGDEICAVINCADIDLLVKYE